MFFELLLIYYIVRFCCCKQPQIFINRYMITGEEISKLSQEGKAWWIRNWRGWWWFRTSGKIFPLIYDNRGNIERGGRKQRRPSSRSRRSKTTTSKLKPRVLHWSSSLCKRRRDVCLSITFAFCNWKLFERMWAQRAF